MQQPVRLSRLERRMRDEALRPPHPVSRVLGMLPILAVALLLVVRSTYAWFTGNATVTAPTVVTGDWVSLMEPDTLGSVTFTARTQNQSQPYTESFTVTSTATIPMYLGYEWASAAGTQPGVSFADNATSQPLAGNMIQPNQTVRVMISTTYPSEFSGSLRLFIGTNQYDTREASITIPVKVEVPDIIDIDVVDGQCMFKAGLAGPQTNWVLVIQATQLTNPNAVINVSKTAQKSNAPSGEQTAWLTAGPLNQQPPNNYDTTSATFTNNGTNGVWVAQFPLVNGYPTTVEMTFSSSTSGISGTVKKYVILGHASDINALRNAGVKCPTSMADVYTVGPGGKVTGGSLGVTAKGLLGGETLPLDSTAPESPATEESTEITATEAPVVEEGTVDGGTTESPTEPPADELSSPPTGDLEVTE